MIAINENRDVLDIFFLLFAAIGAIYAVLSFHRIKTRVNREKNLQTDSFQKTRDLKKRDKGDDIQNKEIFSNRLSSKDQIQKIVLNVFYIVGIVVFLIIPELLVKYYFFKNDVINEKYDSDFMCYTVWIYLLGVGSLIFWTLQEVIGEYLFNERNSTNHEKKYLYRYLTEKFSKSITGEKWRSYRDICFSITGFLTFIIQIVGLFFDLNVQNILGNILLFIYILSLIIIILYFNKVRSFLVGQ